MLEGEVGLGVGRGLATGVAGLQLRTAKTAVRLAGAALVHCIVATVVTEDLKFVSKV